VIIFSHFSSISAPTCGIWIRSFFQRILRMAFPESTLEAIQFTIWLSLAYLVGYALKRLYNARMKVIRLRRSGLVWFQPALFQYLSISKFACLSILADYISSQLHQDTTSYSDTCFISRLTLMNYHTKLIIFMLSGKSTNWILKMRESSTSTYGRQQNWCWLSYHPR